MFDFWVTVQLSDGANFKCITNLNGAAPKPGRSAPKVTKFVLQTKVSLLVCYRTLAACGCVFAK